VVDDGSSDQTYAVATEQARELSNVKVIRQLPNQGKGRAVQTGITEATGEFVIVQDADLEYDPQDYIPMLRALRAASGPTAVYGSRTLGQWQSSQHSWLFPGRHPQQSLGPWLAGSLLTLWTFLLFGRWITDTLTAYKIYPTRILRSFRVKTRGFETDHELTAKLIRAGLSIVEVPVQYFPRSIAEGKKISPIDGIKAVWTLLRFRFTR